MCVLGLLVDLVYALVCSSCSCLCWVCLFALINYWLQVWSLSGIFHEQVQLEQILLFHEECSWCGTTLYEECSWCNLFYFTMNTVDVTSIWSFMNSSVDANSSSSQRVELMRLLHDTYWRVQLMRLFHDISWTWIDTKIWYKIENNPICLINI